MCRNRRSRIAVKSLLGQSTRNIWETEGQGGIPQHLCRGATHHSAMSISPFYRAILPVPDSAFTHTHTHIYTHMHTYSFHKYVHTRACEYMNTYTLCSCVYVCGSFPQCLSNTIKVVLEKGNLKGIHFQSHKCLYTDINPIRIYHKEINQNL